MSSMIKLCASHELPSKLLELLREGPTTADTLARLTGYSGNSIRERLAILMADGYVTRKLEPRPTSGAHYMWNITAAGDKFRSLPDLQRIKSSPREGQVHQVITTSYPIIGRRDPLVSALFGAGHREAA